MTFSEFTCIANYDVQKFTHPWLLISVAVCSPLTALSSKADVLPHKRQLRDSHATHDAHGGDTC